MVMEKAFEKTTLDINLRKVLHNISLAADFLPAAGGCGFSFFPFTE